MNQTDWKRKLLVMPSVRSVPHMEWRRYRSSGVRWLAFDIENTLEPLVKSGSRELSVRTVAHLRALYREYDFGICLATNSMSDFGYMMEQLREASIPSSKLRLVQPQKKRYIFFKWPAKQHPEYWEMLAKAVGARPHEIVMLGDKLLFDIGPALDAGFYKGIWVAPLGDDLRLEKLARRRAREENVRRKLNLDDPNLMTT